MPPLPPQRLSGMGQRCDKKVSSGNCRCGRGLCKPCLPVCRASAWTCRHHEYRVGGGGPWAGWNESCSPRSPRPAPPSEAVPGNFSHGWQWLQGGETVSEALKEESGRQQKRESNP